MFWKKKEKKLDFKTDREMALYFAELYKEDEEYEERIQRRAKNGLFVVYICTGLIIIILVYLAVQLEIEYGIFSKLFS